MFKYEVFKECCKADIADEFYVIFHNKPYEYMIIIYQDSVSFQRCGGLECDECGSGEMSFKDLDELYEAQLIDGIILKRDWGKIETIYPNGYGSFDEYCYVGGGEYLGELTHYYDINCSLVPHEKLSATEYDYAFNMAECSEDANGILFEVEPCNENKRGVITKYLVYAQWLYDTERCYLEDKDAIVVTTNYAVLKIDLKTHTVVATYDAEDEYLWSIHYSPHENEYIIRYELGVIMLYQNLNKKWMFDVAEVATPMDGPDTFTIKGRQIEFTDFNGKHWRVDYNGEGKQL